MKGCCSGILFVIEKIPEKQILSLRVDPVEKVRVASSESLPIYLKVIVVRQYTSLSYYIKIPVYLTLSVPETKIAEFANSVDHDEVVHNEPPHLDLLCLQPSHRILNMIWLR